MERSTSAQNPPRVSLNQIIDAMRLRPGNIQELPDIETSLNVNIASEVPLVQQNTKKRRVMFASSEDGEVKRFVANIMTGFHDVPIMATYSLAGEKSDGEDVPIAPWSKKQCDLGFETQTVDSHEPPSPGGKSTKGRSRGSIVGYARPRGSQTKGVLNKQKGVVESKVTTDPAGKFVRAVSFCSERKCLV